MKDKAEKKPASCTRRIADVNNNGVDKSPIIIN
jgi:hypothetical protein